MPPIEADSRRVTNSWRERICKPPESTFIPSRLPVRPPRTLGTKVPSLPTICPQTGGHGRGLGAPLHVGLAQRVGDVVLDRLLGQEHPLADLPVGQALADQLQDLPLL